MRNGQFSVRRGPVLVAAVGVMVGAPLPALANKVHWKDDPRVPGCSGLAFDDTNEWFANEAGFAFKRGVCHGERIRYKVTLAPDRESFTVFGANVCIFRVGDNNDITAACRPSEAK